MRRGTRSKVILHSVFAASTMGYPMKILPACATVAALVAGCASMRAAAAVEPARRRAMRRKAP